MNAFYDDYDYPSYWLEREYEHKSEVVAIKGLLEKIPKIKKIVEVGAGYGRLTPSYSFRGKHIILTDPSAKLLKIAKLNLRNKKIKFIRSKAENLKTKIKNKSVDLVIIVRVLHHIKNIDFILKMANRVLKKNGYLILEYANSQHFKARLREIFKGNLTFFLDIFPKQVGEISNKEGTLPFLNYHPDTMSAKLAKGGFRIIETRSVSNIRSTYLKKIIPLETMLEIEKVVQKPLSYIHFGPSMFVLAQKRK